jgi:hypothetical protein
MDDITTTVVPNDRGTEDVQIAVNESDGTTLAQAIEATATDALKVHMRRKEFSGKIQISVPGSTAAQAQLAAAASTQGPSVLRASSVTRTRIWLGAGILLAIGIAVGVRYMLSGPFPRSVEFGRLRLTKATDWDLIGVNGGVYTLPGEKLPDASMQVGAIVSTAHQTAKELDAWVHAKYIESGTKTFHDADNGSEVCRIGESPTGPGTRAFLTLQVCKTGVRRSACVESDEPVPYGVVTNCQALTSAKNRTACFDEVCAQRWPARVESLEQLAADFLAR